VFGLVLLLLHFGVLQPHDLKIVSYVAAQMLLQGDRVVKKTHDYLSYFYRIDL